MPLSSSLAHFPPIQQTPSAESRRRSLSLSPPHAPALPHNGEYVLDAPAVAAALVEYENYVFFDPVAISR